MKPVEAIIDLELIAQRVIKLAEIATLEHLELLLRSQAVGVLDWHDAAMESSASAAAN